MNRTIKAIFFFMLIGLIFIIPYSTGNASAQAEILVSSQSTKTRVTTGETIGVNFRLEWASSGKPVTEASVVVNGKQYPRDLTGGWLFIQSSSDYVGNVIWAIDSISVDGIFRSFEMVTPNPSCIFDEVKVTIEAVYNRIGLGQSPEISFSAYYEYDGQRFSGTIQVNDSIPSDVVTTRKIDVTSIVDDKYSINKFDANSVTIIWDNVYIQGVIISKHRYDLTTDPQLSFNAYYEYDQSKFDGVANIEKMTQSVGNQRVTVSSIMDNKYDVRSFIAEPFNLIFDQVAVDLTVEDTRVNVADRIEVDWDAYYLYDNTTFEGKVTIGPSTKMLNVGVTTITVSEIDDPEFGLSSFISNKVEVVWDKIRVDLSTPEARVSVGDIVDVSVDDAYYEYDGEKIDHSDVHLNDVSKSLNTVGEFIFKVDSVESKYGIDKFTSNDVRVVWDNIQFEIETPRERIILGSTDTPTVTAHYGYGGAPFYGTYELNQDFGTKMGPVEYYITKMNDESRGLTAFTTNRVEFYFDQIQVQSSISQSFPGIYKTILEVTYVTDGTPVNNAEVIVDGVHSSYIGNGVYQAEMISLFPYIQSHASVFINENIVENMVTASVMIGNVVGSAVLLGAGGLGLNKYILSGARKARKLEETKMRAVLKQQIIAGINQKWGLIELDELPLKDVKSSLRTELINEALHEGWITGRLNDNGTKFIHTGYVESLIRKRLTED